MVMQTIVKEITVKSALHFHKRPTATYWDLNIYRGCAHQCRYCYALYSHQYLHSNHFFNEIFVKTNIAEKLDEEFSKRRWRGEPVTLSGVSDCYQPVEKDYQLMPRVLRVFHKHKNPIVISTKSLLIRRDIGLIRDLCQVTQVFVSTSLSTIDETVAKKLEPKAPSPQERLTLLAELKAAGCITTLLYMPVIPYLTDSESEMEMVFSLLKAHHVDNVHAGVLNLRGMTQTTFLSFLRTTFPTCYENLNSLYRSKSRLQRYRQKCADTIHRLRQQYDLFNHSLPELDPPEQDQQLDLFD
jgi:DNA repair photolyase